MKRKLYHQIVGWACITFGILSASYLAVDWHWRLAFGVFLLPVGLWLIGWTRYHQNRERELK